MRRAMFAFVGVAALASLIFMAFQSWAVLTRIGDGPTGELAAPAEDPSLQVAAAGQGDIGFEVAEVDAAEEPTAEEGALESALPLEEEEPAAVVADEWVAPVPYSELVPPGWRRSAQGGYWYYENATVLRTASGNTVVASAPGIVAAASPADGGGWNVDILHEDDYLSRYGNVFQPMVRVGDEVKAHSPIGYVGGPSRKDVAGEPALPAVSFTAWHSGQVVDAAGLFGVGP